MEPVQGPGALSTPSPEESSKLSRLLTAAIVLALAAGYFWYSQNPRWWLMPDRESERQIDEVLSALSNDDPATEIVPVPRYIGEAMSDRKLFAEWLVLAALDPDIPVPATVGEAISYQRAAVQEQALQHKEARERAAIEAAEQAANVKRMIESQKAERERQQQITNQRLAEEAECSRPAQEANQAYMRDFTAELGHILTVARAQEHKCLMEVRGRYPGRGL